MKAVTWCSVGFFISIIVGGILVPIIYRALRGHIERQAHLREEVIPTMYFQPLDCPLWLFSTIERFFFTILVAFNVSATAAAMIGWITIKMVTDWNRIRKDDTVGVRSLAMLGLLGNVLSMLFALVGGLVCRIGFEHIG